MTSLYSDDVAVEVSIASDALARILAHAASAPEREVCGLLLGRPGLVTEAQPTANVVADPETEFELDPAAHFAALRAARDGGPAVLGHYHSHPSGEPAPSPRDAAMALETGQLWLIVAPPRFGLWIVSRPGTFEGVRLTVLDSGGCARDAQPPERPA